MELSCPKCGSHDLHADKKGFSGSNAAAGAVLAGGIGLLAGTIGSNKIKITCLKCGFSYLPGHEKEQLALEAKQAKNRATNKKLLPLYLIMIVAIVAIVIYVSSHKTS